jgi:hypothetical protein
MPRLTDNEIARLRAALDPATEAIAFAEGTEPPFSHPLNSEKRDGIYHCAVCDEAAFSAANKYESGSALLLAAGPAGGDRDQDRLQTALSAHRDSLRQLRCSYGPCIFRRAATDRRALLSQWRCAGVSRRRYTEQMITR